MAASQHLSQPRSRWLDRRRRLLRLAPVRWLEQVFALRLLLALALGIAALVVVNRWEHCRNHNLSAACLTSDAGGVVTVGNLEALSIVTASMLYVLEGGRRRQREHVEAMELILTCQQAGVRVSHARDQALEQLAHAGLWLDGLDLRGAVLDELRLPGARWRGAQLAGASLRHADLRGCDLQDADLSAADLTGADLRDANLGGANLQGALLEGAYLHGVGIDATS